MEHSQNYIHSEAIDLTTYCLQQDWTNAKRILQRTPEVVNYSISEFGYTIVYSLCLDFDSYKPIAFDILDTPSVNVDIPDKNNVTPLMCAIINKRFELARELLKRGANPNHTNTDTMLNLSVIRGTSVLHLSAIHNDVKFIEMLINAGAHINCTNGNGLTPKELLKNKLNIGPKSFEYRSEKEKQATISRWQNNINFLENYESLTITKCSRKGKASYDFGWKNNINFLENYESLTKCTKK